MRKEVKLGMTLGGGAVALLVGYLLVAPPSNKKGTQLVGSGGGGSIIDNSQPGDLSAGGTGEDRGSAAKPDAAQGAPANNGAATGNVEQPQQPKPPVDQPPAKVEEKPAGGKAGGDKWTVLNSGKVAKPAAPGDSQTTHHENMPIENRLTARRGGSERVDGGAGSGAVADARAAAPRSRQEARLYFNPSGAWGDGLSTDGVVAHSGVGRGGAKATVVEATADALKAGGTHVVKSGETFSSIAAAVYGSAAYYPHLVRANPQANPNNLKLGTVINIPPMEQVKATGSSERGVGAPAVTQDAKLDPTRQYKVQSGDSLYKISVKVYGKSTYVDRIYEANKAAIGPNPTKLKLGMVLELPEKAGTIASTSAGNDAPIGDAQSGPENDGK